MRIKKVAPTTSIQAQVINTYNTSDSDTYSCDYINNSESYSTNEVKTNKRWIDNKPIYRKVFYVASPSNSEDISSGILPSNIVWCDGQVLSGGYLNKLNSNEADSNYKITYDISTNGTIRFRAGNSQSSLSNLIVIIEYTKTTD